MAYETQKFLSDYGVKHCVSSVAFPHSNQRAELAVKSMKRLIGTIQVPTVDLIMTDSCAL